MKEHKIFHYNSMEELQKEINELGVNIQLNKDINILKKPVAVGNRLAPNAMAVLPMEGCDSNPDGSPSELVRRRYLRFASGGSGLLWWEANAVTIEGKANPLQMMITKENLPEFITLIREAKEASIKSTNSSFGAINILQLTHSGRYSRPYDHKARPMIPQHDPILDKRMGIPSDYPVVTEEYLDNLKQKYVTSALLAKEAGFDGVDIKACHRYLISELLASHTREDKYGGDFQNRTRFLLDTIREVRKAVGQDFIIASRFNVFDAHPYPYGFGCDKEDMWKFDDSEPVQLVKAMCDAGVDLLSNSAGNPYYLYPQVTRPFDHSSMGIPTPSEHQLVSMERLFEFTRRIQNTAGDIPVVGNGYSWLRQFAPYVGAANIVSKSCSFVGLGRSSFAYPDATKDLFNEGEMNPKKCCITCSKCTQIMRNHGKTGCVIRDSNIYANLYKEAREEANKRENV